MGSRAFVRKIRLPLAILSLGVRNRNTYTYIYFLYSLHRFHNTYESICATWQISFTLRKIYMYILYNLIFIDSFYMSFSVDFLYNALVRLPRDCS